MKNIKIILYIITLVITNNSISLSEVTPSVPTNMLQQIVSSSFSDQNFSTPELQVPSYYTDWERGFQGNNFRPTIIENKISCV